MSDPITVTVGAFDFAARARIDALTAALDALDTQVGLLQVSGIGAHSEGLWDPDTDYSGEAVVFWIEKGWLANAGGAAAGLEPGVSSVWGELPITAGTSAYTIATRPAASVSNVGVEIFVTDVDGGQKQRSNGTSWVTTSPSVDDPRFGVAATTLNDLGEQTDDVVIDLADASIHRVVAAADLLVFATEALAPLEAVLIVVQDDVGGRKVGLPIDWSWLEGAAPTLSLTASSGNLIRVIYDGVRYYASHFGTISAAVPPEIAQAIAAQSNTTTATVTWPSTPVDGNRLLATVTQKGTSAGVVTDLSGWTPVTTLVGDSFVMKVFTKIADGEADVVSTTVDNTFANGWTIQLVEVDGAGSVDVVAEVMDDTSDPLTSLTIDSDPDEVASAPQLAVLMMHLTNDPGTVTHGGAFFKVKSGQQTRAKLSRAAITAVGTVSATLTWPTNIGGGNGAAAGVIVTVTP